MSYLPMSKHRRVASVSLLEDTRRRTLWKRIFRQ